MQVGESVVNAIVEYHAQGSEEAHAEENRMFLRYLRELTGTQRVAVEVARKYFSPVRGRYELPFSCRRHRTRCDGPFTELSSFDGPGWPVLLCF